MFLFLQYHSFPRAQKNNLNPNYTFFFYFVGILLLFVCTVHTRMPRTIHIFNMYELNGNNVTLDIIFKPINRVKKKLYHRNKL